MIRFGPIRLLGVLLVVGAVGACQPARRASVRPNAKAVTRAIPAAAPATKPLAVSRPLIDFGRGAAGLPLDSLELPDDAGALARSLVAAYGARVQTGTDRATVRIDGHYPSLDLVKIDLSEGSIRPAYRPSQLDGVASLTPALDVGRLEYVAWPVRYGPARSYLRIKADDVKLALLKPARTPPRNHAATRNAERGNSDRANPNRPEPRATLVMTEARAGLLQFHMSQADLRAAMLDAAKAYAGRAAFTVSGMDLTMSSANGRSLSASLRIDGVWFLLPSSLTFNGTLTVDDAFNARFSNFDCRGNDVGGSVLASFLDPMIAKFNGKVAPIAAFPGKRIRVTDVRLEATPDVHLFVEFGSREE